MEHTAAPAHADTPAATAPADERLEGRVDELEAEVERLARPCARSRRASAGTRPHSAPGRGPLEEKTRRRLGQAPSESRLARAEDD